MNNLEIVVAIGQLAITASVAFLAYQQHKLAVSQEKRDIARLKHEIFDRRIEIIDRASKLVHSEWSKDTLAELDAIIAMAELLFPNAAVAELKGMREIGVKGMARLERQDFTESETREERDRRIKDDLLEKVGQKYGSLVRITKELLTVRDYVT